MDTGMFINYILGTILRKIVVPSDFHEQVKVVKEMQNNDISGLVDSLTDFAVDSACVEYSIETDNDTFSATLKRWLDEVNKEYGGQIPSGIKALAKEYFRERWKYSSFPVLKIGNWGKINGVTIPTKMYFVDGGSVYAKDKNEGEEALHLINYDYFIGHKMDNKNKLSNNCIFAKPYGRWFDKYPTPYLIKRGIYNNWRIIQSLKNKETQILDQIIPYLLLIKKGTSELALQKDISYSNLELQAVIKEFQKLIDEVKSVNTSSEGTTKAPIRATNFDEEIKHLIPDLSTIFKADLFEVAEKSILSGLGFIDIAEAVSTSRRESILNPKVFIEEVRSGVEDFKQLLKELVFLIKSKNENHKKYINSEFYISASPVRAFMTDEFKTHLRLLWKNGQLSNQTYCEMVGEVEFRTEVSRREKEAKNGTEIIMYPHQTQNREDTESFEEIKRQQKFYEEEKVDKKGKPLPPDKTEPEQKEEYDIGKYKTPVKCPNCENIFDMLAETESHMGAVKCPKCETEVTQKDLIDGKKDNLETSPYKTIKELPARVKNNLDIDLQRVFMRVFNNAYKTYKNDTRAFRVAWALIKQIARKGKDGKWHRRRKRVRGKLQKIQITRAMVEEVLEKEEKRTIEESLKLKKLEIANYQSELLKNLLSKSKEKK